MTLPNMRNNKVIENINSGDFPGAQDIYRTHHLHAVHPWTPEMRSSMEKIIVEVVMRERKPPGILSKVPYVQTDASRG